MRMIDTRMTRMKRIFADFFQQKEKNNANDRYANDTDQCC